LQAAFILTPAGHAEFHPVYERMSTQPVGLSDEETEQIGAFARALPGIVQAVVDLATYLFPEADGTMIVTFMYAYLRDASFWAVGDGDVREWARRRFAAVRDSAEYHFAATEEVLTQVPATEAAERLISVMECHWRKNRMGAGINLIESSMLIRPWQIYRPNDIARLVAD
jgi:hypothetical protein